MWIRKAQIKGRSKLQFRKRVRERERQRQKKRNAQACGHSAQQIQTENRKRKKRTTTVMRCYCLWCKIELLKNSSSVYRLLCTFFFIRSVTRSVEPTKKTEWEIERTALVCTQKLQTIFHLRSRAGHNFFQRFSARFCCCCCYFIAVDLNAKRLFEIEFGERQSESIQRNRK